MPTGGACYIVPGMAGMIISVASGKLIVSFSAVFPLTDTYCLSALTLFFPGRTFIKENNIPASFRGRYYISKLT
jgi:hypothetical protein